MADNDAIGVTWEREAAVECVVCPWCAFTFDAIHTDPGGGYSCPECGFGGKRAPYPPSQMAEKRNELSQRASTMRTCLNAAIGYLDLEAMGVPHAEHSARVRVAVARLREELDGFLDLALRPRPHTGVAPGSFGDPLGIGSRTAATPEKRG